MNLPFDPAEVSRCLLAWYGKEGRDLPWRNTRDPYRIWLSEIMLQQTTVAAVIPYFERFLQRFPTLIDLTAQQIIAEQGGTFPDNLEGLTALPGIGRSTAGAILSIAFDKPAPILDGNVRRVLVRLFAWQEDPRSSRAEKQLWAWAEVLTSQEQPHDYAQAIMDLGATLCTPRDPDCENCPLQELCQAHKEGLATTLPVARKKVKSPVRQQVALIVSSPAGCLLRQRPLQGFLGGMWEFPTIDVPAKVDPEQAAVRLLTDLGLQGSVNSAGEVRHAYSHFKLELTVFTVDTEPTEKISEPNDYRWCSDREVENLPVHGAHKKAYKKLQSTN
jgi:A/G-specific adenine glycosylase